MGDHKILGNFLDLVLELVVISKATILHI